MINEAERFYKSPNKTYNHQLGYHKSMLLVEQNTDLVLGAVIGKFGEWESDVIWFAVLVLFVGVYVIWLFGGYLVICNVYGE